MRWTRELEWVLAIMELLWVYRIADFQGCFKIREGPLKNARKMQEMLFQLRIHCREEKTPSSIGEFLTSGENSEFNLD